MIILSGTFRLDTSTTSSFAFTAASWLVRTDQQKSWDFSWAFAPDSWVFDPFCSVLSQIGYSARHSILCWMLLEYLDLCVLFLATPAGIEPATFSLEVPCGPCDFKAHSDKLLRITPFERKRQFPIVGMSKSDRDTTLLDDWSARADLSSPLMASTRSPAFPSSSARSMPRCWPSWASKTPKPSRYRIGRCTTYAAPHDR